MSELQKVKAILLDVVEYPSERLSQSSRTMLVDGLPHTLPDPSLTAGELHPFQKQFVDCIKEALNGIKTTAVTVVQTTADSLHQIEEQIKSAQVAQETAATGNENANNIVKTETDAYASAQAEVKDTHAEHVAAQELEKGYLKNRQLLNERKKCVDALLASMDRFEKSDGKDTMNLELTNFLTRANAEATLLAAVPNAMKIPPSARGKFDSLTLAEVRKIIECEVTKVNTELAASEMETRQITSETLGLWAIHDVAQDRMVEASAILNQSKEDAQAAKKTLQAAEAEVKRQQTALSATSLQQTLAEKKVQEVDEALGALEKLCCQPAAPMEV